MSVKSEPPTWVQSVKHQCIKYLNSYSNPQLTATYQCKLQIWENIYILKCEVKVQMEPDQFFLSGQFKRSVSTELTQQDILSVKPVKYYGLFIYISLFKANVLWHVTMHIKVIWWHKKLCRYWNLQESLQ